MATYQYKARTPEGMAVKGVVQAATVLEAANKVRQTAPVIESISEVKDSKSILNAEIGSHLNIKNLSVMCKQISITLRSGIQLARCLEMIGQQTEDKLLRRMLLTCAEDVSSGSALSTSMVRNCPKLPVTFIETIKAGEESGNIDKSFEEMAVYYERQYKTMNKIKSALRYPTFVVAIAIIVLIVVMTMVVPSLTKTFDELGGELPIITLILINISRFFGKYWALIGVIIVGFIVFIHLYNKTPKGAIIHGKFQLRAPIIGKLHRLNAAAQFANTMSILLKSGLTVDRAVDITAKTIDNAVLSNQISDMTGRIEEGRPLGECIRKVDGLPDTLKEMCAIGEETGDLDNTLEVIGDFYTSESDTATKDMLARLEPAMLVFLAIFAGFIVIAIYMPMFTMYNMM